MMKAATPQDYLDSLSDDRKGAMKDLRKALKENLPAGFEETINYGMIGYVVPHGKYPKGYHCDPKLPLPFISIASQKNFIALYHMGLYADEDLKKWFIAEFTKRSKYKLDMGKSCIRFKKADQIPFSLIEELATKMTCDEWISLYERNLKR